MAITIADYSYRQLITGDAPASSLSGFVVLITEANVDSTFWDNVDNGGGDVRVSINEDGTSQLPLEIVLCNTATDKLIAWVRFPTYSTSARELYLFSGNSGQSKAGETTTYGRNNVWQDYHFASHDGVINSTGSGATTTETGTPVFNSDGVDLDGATVTYGVASLEDVELVSFKFDVTVTSGTTNRYFVNAGGGGYYDGPFGVGMFQNTGRSLRAFKSNNNGNLIATSASNVFVREVRFTVHSTYDQTSGTVIYVNGSSVASGGTSGTYKKINPKLEIGNSNTDIIMHNVYAYQGVISADKAEAESSNQSDPANFWAQSTPDDPSGGGGATEYDLTLSQGVYSLTGQTIKLLSERAISLNQGGYSTTGAIFTFDYVVPSNYNFLLNAGTYSTTGQDIALLTERSVTLSQGSYSTTGNDIGLTTERAISLDQGNYDVTGQPVSLLTERAISLDQGSYDLTGQPVNLLADRVLDLQQGSYTLTGRSITFSYIETNAYNLVLGQGSYSTIGSDFTFDYVVPNQYNITLASGSYSTTGDDVSLLVERMLTMGAGSYSSEGLPITALFHRQLTMDAGVYTTVGSSVSIAYSEFSGFEIGSYSISFVQTPVQAYYDDLLVNTTYKH